MSEIVLDASVLLAVLKQEPFNEQVLDLLEGATMSAVNYAEVWTKLHEIALTNAPRTEATFALLSMVEPFTPSQARLAADLRLRTRHLGLSLGDRACLALALELNADVYTAERNWAKADVGCRVHLIR